MSINVSHRDWRVGLHVAVKYRTDKRFGTKGTVLAAGGDRLTSQTTTGEIIEDDQDNWRTD